MPQSVWTAINPATTSGTQLATLLNDFKNAVMSGLSGTSRPTQTTAGGAWIDTTNEGSPNFYWSYKIYDGTTDIEVFRVNLATGKASIAGSDSEFEVSKISADAAGPLIKFVKQRIASSGQVNAGDTIGEIRFVGRANDASNPVVASIKVIAQENQTSSAAGSYLAFFSTPAGTVTAAEFMRVFNSKLGIGTQAPETKVHVVSPTGIKSEANSDDAVGGIVTVEKSRIAGNGSVQTSDVIGEIDYSAKDSTGAKSVTAKIESLATEGHTGSAKGTRMSVKTINTGASTLTEKLSIGSEIESIVRHKMNATELVSQSVATAATINQLSADKNVVEFTGSTATSVRGLNSAHASKVVLLHNLSTADITLEHESSGATAADRLKLPFSTPITISPQSSIELFYSVTDTRWKLKSGSGSGSGSSGSGGKNYAALLFAGTTVNGINQYADSGATPTDGTGGSPAGLTTGLNTSTPLRGTSNQRFSKDASSRQGLGWSYDITLDPADYEGGKPVNIQFRFKNSTNYVNNDVRMFVYDKDGTTLYNVLSASGDGSIPKGSSTSLYTGTFFPNPANNDYRIIFHITSTNALAWDLDLIDLTVGPQSVVAGTIITEWVPYTPVITAFGTPTGVSFFSRRVGDSLEVAGKFVAGISTAVPNSITIGYDGVSGNVTIDSAKIPAGNLVGVAGQSGAGASFFGFGVIANAGASTVQITQQSSTIGITTGSQNGSALTSSNTIELNFTVPIVGWMSSNIISTTESAFLSAVPVVATSGTKTPAASGHYHSHTGNSLALTPGIWRLSMLASFGNSGAAPPYQIVDCGWRAGNGADNTSDPAAITTISGLTLLTSSTQPNVQYNFTSANNNNLQVPGPTIVVRVTQNCTVFMSSYATMTTASNARITLHGMAEKIPDFSVFGIYGVHEILNATSAIKTPVASNVYAAMTGNSITLTPGTWKLFGSCYFSAIANPAYTTAGGLFYGANGADTGTAPASLASLPGVTVISSNHLVDGSLFTPRGDYGHMPVPDVIIRCTQPTTIFLVAFAAMTTASNARITVHANAQRLQ